jgi:hypothetical protein
MSTYFHRVARPEEGLWCPQPGCQFLSESKSALTTHANEEHIQFKQFSCTVCPLKFVTFKEICEHMKVDHSLAD